MDRKNAVSKYSLSMFDRIFCIGAIFFGTIAAPHAALANGGFVSDKSCPLYQSKNKQTNPDKLLSTVGQNYPVVEILGDDTAPEWLRVRTSASISPLRWIQGNCGQYTAAKTRQSAADIEPTSTNNKTSQPLTKTQGNLCQMAGNFDSHVLALSWQSTFCELYGKRKAECRALTETRDSPQWQHFSLHGLWPNRQQCGIAYGFCAQVKQQPSDFCRYPEVPLNPSVQKQLTELMPSARYGSCLERHEWWKHGSCRDQDPNDYFQLASQLTKSVNASVWVQEFIHDRIGKSASLTELKQSFDASFGQGAHTKITLTCAKGLLSEVQMNLPADISRTDSLPSLLAKAPKAKNSNCPDTLLIDNPN